MTDRITVTPAAGRLVPDPEGGDLLPVEGREVFDNSYWRRRKAEGDVTFSNAITPNPAAKSAKSEVAQ